MKSHTNGDIYIACSTALLCHDTHLPSGMGSTAASLRKEEMEEGTVNYIDRENGPTGRVNEMKDAALEERRRVGSWYEQDRAL